jgi:hypothetical protein
MKLSREEGRWAVHNDHEDWERVESHIINHTRWSVHHRGVFKHLPTGKHYRLDWSVGATEQQWERPFEDSDPKPVEVEQVEITIKDWRPVGE